MILLSKYDNYELIFMHNGRAIKFNSSSLQEIKDVNQILIDISYDFKRLRNVRRYKVNGRYYNLRSRFLIHMIRGKTDISCLIMWI